MYYDVRQSLIMTKLYIIANMPVNKFETRYKYIRNLKNFELEKYVQDFKVLPISLVYFFDDPSDQLDTLNKLILNAINEHAPLTKTKFTRPPTPWMKDFEINKLQRERDHWRYEAHSKQTPQSWEKFRAIRNKIKKVINKKKTNFYKKVFQSKNKNDIWKVIHRILSPNPKTLKVDPEKLNEFFNKTAERLVGKRKTDDATLRSYISSLKDKSNSFKLRLVTPTEVSKCIKTLRNDCSTGYDNIPVSFIKPVAEYLESPLTFIINNFIVTSTFPGIWKIARISPIPKILNPSQLKDYRPISILPILSKIYEKLVLQQMTEFIEKQLIYHKHQSGYRKNHSTTTLLMKLYDDIKTSMNKSEITIAIFADYSKAFDTIDFYTLIQKMHTFNFSKNFLYWTMNYLTFRQHLYKLTHIFLLF